MPLGSGPDRGQSTAEWGEIPPIRPSVGKSVPPGWLSNIPGRPSDPTGSSSDKFFQPADPLCRPSDPSSWPSDPSVWPSDPLSWPSAQPIAGVWTPSTCWHAILRNLTTVKQQGKGTSDHMMPLGN